MGRGISRRDISDQVAKHFHGTAAARLLLALELGRRALTLYRAAQPGPTSREEALASLRRANGLGRRRCQLTDGA